MSDRPAHSHFGEELQDFLDGRLTEARRSEIAAHVATCARCQRELHALRWVKTEAPRQLPDVEMPQDLPLRLRTALDAEDAAIGRSSLVSRVPRRAWIAAALAAAALLVFFARGHKVSPTPALVGADFAAYEAGSLTLEVVSGDPKAVEAHFARGGLRFDARVFDLAMMQYRLEGGRIHRLGDSPSALYAYRGPDNVALLCQMYEGSLSELPAPVEVRQNNGITFRVYKSANLTMVFWEEGDIVCVLASSAPTETVVQLAFAKAVRVEPNA